MGLNVLDGKEAGAPCPRGQHEYVRLYVSDRYGIRTEGWQCRRCGGTDTTHRQAPMLGDRAPTRE